MASRSWSARPGPATGAWFAVLQRVGARKELIGGVFGLAGAIALAVSSYALMVPTGELAVGSGQASAYAVLAVVPAVVLTVAGLLARWSHPASRIGLLLIAEGVAWTIGTVAFTVAPHVAGATELAAVTGFVGYAIGGHVLLSYPSGRLQRPSDRLLVTLLYLACGPLMIIGFLFHADYGPGCQTCPANAFLIAPHDGLDIAGNALWFTTVGVLMAIVGLRSVPRWRAATPLARRSLAPVYLTRWCLTGTIVVAFVGSAAMVFTDTLLWQIRWQLPINLAAMAAAGAIVVVFLRSTAARRAVGTLARELDAAPRPLAAGRLEHSLRAALGDPEARLLFARVQNAPWIGSGGKRVTPAPSRAVTGLVSDGTVAVEHDPALSGDPEVLEAVGAVAGLALDADRLRALVAAEGPEEAARMPGQVFDGMLTGREREVLALVAGGMTDAAIAQRLYLTRRTVETHLNHIFNKLGVPAGAGHNRRVHAVVRYLDAVEAMGRPRVAIA